MPFHRSPWLLCGYFQHNHLALRRSILTVEFSSVRRATSIPEVLTKSYVVVFFIKSPPLLTCFVQSLIALHFRSSTRVDFSSELERLMMGGHFLHLQEESGLDRRMLFVECPIPEQTLTLPM